MLALNLNQKLMGKVQFSQSSVQYYPNQFTIEDPAHTQASAQACKM